MSIIQVTGSGKSAVSDRTPFYGARVPTEVKSMVKPLSKLEKSVFRKILLLIVTAVEGKDVEYKQLKDLESKDFQEETLCVIYSGLLKLLQCALKLPTGSLKQELFKEDLQELQIPEDFHTDIASVIFGNRRAQIDCEFLNSRPRLPQLDRLKWRVDVGISTSVLNRVLEPTVLMEMTLTDGNIHSFEVPVSKFHELRYNVAYVLKEMEDLEKRNILKIKD
ncbi:COMM domain-containing protein 5-like [Mercenaria mercenaria]|uniref:COMM domain-containing protein 5-like n=1 Tax=Mercenaria mercenaria TaxID=6596 RepID=UPI00234E957B|nr:COMM domain-containing protein 5-like [Mercenaria mercenaria]